MNTENRSNENDRAIHDYNHATTFSVNFLPSKETLAQELLRIKEFIYQSKKCQNVEIKLIANCGLILLLVPLILSVKERLRIEFVFEANSADSMFTTDYDNCKNFKDILEASLVLKKLGFNVNFSKTFSNHK